MSGSRNSGRRPAKENVVDFGAAGVAGAKPKEPATIEPPVMSPRAAAHWPSVVAEAHDIGTVLPRDCATLGKICEQLVTMDFIRAAKGKKRFNPLTDAGLRVARLERQTTKEIERLWKGVRRDIESRANARPVRQAATGTASATPPIRDFVFRGGARE